MTDETNEGQDRDARDDELTNAKLPAGLEADGRDEELERGDLVHPSGAGRHGHTTPPGTSLPEATTSDQPGP